jgi:hypothetical protein
LEKEPPRLTKAGVREALLAPGSSGSAGCGAELFAEVALMEKKETPHHMEQSFHPPLAGAELQHSGVREALLAPGSSGSAGCGAELFAEDALMEKKEVPHHMEQSFHPPLAGAELQHSGFCLAAEAAFPPSLAHD